MTASHTATELLGILRCPRTGQALSAATPELVAEINRRVLEPGTVAVTNVGGRPVDQQIDGALLCQDGTTCYLVVDTIPILLIDEAVALPLS